MYVNGLYHSCLLIFADYFGLAWIFFVFGLTRIFVDYFGLGFLVYTKMTTCFPLEGDRLLAAAAHPSGRSFVRGHGARALARLRAEQQARPDAGRHRLPRQPLRLAERLRRGLPHEALLFLQGLQR